MLTTINSTAIIELLLSGFFTFIVGVATGVTTHFVRREMDKRIENWQKEIPRQRFGKPRRQRLLEQFRRVMTPLIPLLPVLIIVLLIGSYWMFVGYFTTMGVIVGLRWTNQ